MITSVYESQIELMKNLTALYAPEGIELDPCFNIGSIYKGIEKPRIKSDLYPRISGIEKADCRKLMHLSSGSITNILFDPPFLAGGGENGVMNKKYGPFPKTMNELLEFYEESLREFFRLLAPSGKVFFKCQDICNGKTQTFSHCEIYNMSISIGYYARDIFILSKKNKIGITGIKKQIHARKSHCYFWVLEKGNRNNKRWGLSGQ